MAAGAGEGRHDAVRQDLAALFTLAWPVVISRLGMMTMGVSDAIVVGRYSAVQLGWHAMAWAPSTVVLVVGTALLGGVQVMTARAIGEGRPEQTGAVLRRGLVYGIKVGVFSAAALFFLGPWLLGLLQLPDDLVAGATPPLQIFALSMPIFVIGSACSAWLEGLGRPRIGAVFMWAANLVNLLALLVLVPGNFDLPALGAAGAAIATLIARAALTLALVVYILRMPEARSLGVFTPAPPAPKAASEQTQIGLGAGASGFFEMTAFAGMNVIAGWLGTLQVATWSIVVNVISVTFMVPLGIATAVSVLVGRAYGAGDVEGIRRISLIAYGATAAFCVVVSLVVWLGAGLIASGYTTDAATLAMAVPALVLCAAVILPDALQVVIAQSLRARGDIMIPTLTHFVSYVLVMAPLAWALALPGGRGVNGIVEGVALASVLSAGLLMARFLLLSRKALA
ncbi:MATE family efflux transporter [Phenylobacterium sp.]|jgi:MATE family multidrug resistance protein|uniref:MATE family efflux transporter n=1 Tax=Phenylobacterium sp. TaxID=1871053 RepID=UPI0025CCBD2C|nr:MATE family efflux transporter [Phenylobacterium sp.]MCA6288621.1 MATE family efflux transporter [Phenylobacterium sp.]MCA6310163.1 MATE family efflux transporter [Phenylobacterium sp.]MCA6322355.1 MATE family efflux transporter [Phenylobacterium sp.]MCA6338131.1 MATE family efflux transporter [Phenylobacterium sp.]MCA6340819.1 MATE family efflux transporter [Phenylobacterium sp.]